MVNHFSLEIQRFLQRELFFFLSTIQFNAYFHNLKTLSSFKSKYKIGKERVAHVQYAGRRI